MIIASSLLPGLFNLPGKHKQQRRFSHPARIVGRDRVMQKRVQFHKFPINLSEIKLVENVYTLFQLKME